MNDAFVGDTQAQRKRTATIVGGYIKGSEGAPTDEIIDEEREVSRRRRVLKLGESRAKEEKEHHD